MRILIFLLAASLCAFAAEKPRWQELLEKGNALRKGGDPKGGRELYETALKEAQPYGFEADLAVRSALAGLAVDLGLYVEAEEYLIPALPPKAPMINVARPLARIFPALLILGLAQLGQKRYDDAVQTFKQSLATAEKALGPQSVALVPILNALAVAHGQLDQRKASQQILARAISISGIAPEDRVETLRLVGEQKLASGDPRGASRALLWALSAAENTYGREHPLVAPALVSLASAYEAIGSFQRAEAALRSARLILSKALGGGHPHVAAVDDRLARLARSAKRPDPRAPTVDVLELRKIRK